MSKRSPRGFRKGLERVALVRGREVLLTQVAENCEILGIFISDPVVGNGYWGY